MVAEKLIKRGKTLERRYLKYGRIYVELKAEAEKRNISDIVPEVAELNEIGVSTVWSIWRGDYL